MLPSVDIVAMKKDGKKNGMNDGCMCRHRGYPAGGQGVESQAATGGRGVSGTLLGDLHPGIPGPFPSQSHRHTWDNT